MNHPEPIPNDFEVIDFDTFADAPYNFICPDCETVEEQNDLNRAIYNALRDAMQFQDSARMLGKAYSTGAATRTAYYLSVLGLAVLRVAESQGLSLRDGEIVQETGA